MPTGTCSLSKRKDREALEGGREGGGDWPRKGTVEKGEEEKVARWRLSFYHDYWHSVFVKSESRMISVYCVRILFQIFIDFS